MFICTLVTFPEVVPLAMISLVVTADMLYSYIVMKPLGSVGSFQEMFAGNVCLLVVLLNVPIIVSSVNMISRTGLGAVKRRGREGERDETKQLMYDYSKFVNFNLLPSTVVLVTFTAELLSVP